MVASEGRLPALFAAYLRIGASIIGGPAIDRDFGTLDFLALLDTESLTRRGRRYLFGEGKS